MVEIDFEPLSNLIQRRIDLENEKVVGVIRCDESYNFEQLDQLDGFKYELKDLPGVVHRTTEGAITILFSNGTVVAVDVSSESEARVALAETLERIREGGIADVEIGVVDNTVFEGPVPVPNEVVGNRSEIGLKNLVKTMETNPRLSKLYELDAITEQEYEILSRSTISEDGQQQSTEYDTVPVAVEQDGFKITIIGVFPDTDISPLLFDDETHHRTVVLWEVYNNTEANAKWGNRALNYVLEDKMKVNPDSGPVIQLDNMYGPWERAPQSGTIAEIGADMKSRWISLVDVPESQRVARATLDGYEHSEVTIEIPASAFGDSKEVPFN